MHNPEIRLISAIEATAIWSADAWVVYPDGASDPYRSVHGQGSYYETYELQNAGWVIREIKMNSRHVTPV